MHQLLAAVRRAPGCVGRRRAGRRGGHAGQALRLGDEVAQQVAQQPHRALARRVCARCGLDYNLIFHRPEKDDTCDVCGGPLITRADDNEEALRKRLDDFATKTRPVVDLFEGKELVHHVDGTADRTTVYQEIRAKLGLV